MGFFGITEEIVYQFFFHPISISVFFEVLTIIVTWAFLHFFIFRGYLKRIREVKDFSNLIRQLVNSREVMVAYARELCHKNTEIKCAAIVHFENEKLTYAIGIQMPDKKIAVPVSFTKKLLELRHPTLIDKKVFASIQKKLDVECKGLFVVPLVKSGSHTDIAIFFLSGRRLHTISKVLHDILFGLTENRIRELTLERGYKRVATNISAIEQSFEKLIEYSPSGMIILDTRLRIQYANLRGCQLFNKKKMDLINQQFLTLFPSEKHQIMLDAIDKIHQGSLMEAMTNFQHISGLNQYYFDIFCYPIRGARKDIVQFVFSIRDTTKSVELAKELRRTQEEATKELEQKVSLATKELVIANKELQHLNELKSEFVSTISHELRTPLTSIKGYISLLANGKLGDTSIKQQKALEVIKNESDRLVTLINDILDISRLESGKTTLHLKQTNIGALIYDVVKTFKASLEEQQQTIKYIKHDIYAPADEGKLKQVLINLLSNASKFSEKGKQITVSISEEPYAVRIKVADNGMGIPKEDLPHIFEAFHRSSKVNEQAIKGTGLGLAIVKHIIDLHKGTISCQSEVGKGTQFTVTLQKESQN